MLRRFAVWLLRVGGWTMVGGIPLDPKAVFIAAPHTSNWDGFWALVYKVAIGIDVKWFAKHSLFWFPLGNILRALGGIDLDRSQAGSAVQQAISLFDESESFYFGLAPEGTRALRPGWKTGFYRIAVGASVPVYLGFLDYGTRRLGIGPRVELSGDRSADLAVIRAFYRDVEGHRPELASPIVFPASTTRTVRSFVRRAGRITTSQQRALEELWPAFGIDHAGGEFDFASLFGRVAPVTLEIGFGNGESLVQQAADEPATNFVGIEVHEPGVGHCLLMARDAGVTNLRLIRHDAVEVLETMIPAASLTRINLYFPDPWPKKRHHKRRIVQPPFLALLADRLVPEGSFNVATDWKNYAEHIDALVSGSGCFECAERRVHAGDKPLDRPGTKFERRGLRHGHRIWDWRFVRAR
jgi:tRNA (guanine-N7-)-methyltransferase